MGNKNVSFSVQFVHMILILLSIPLGLCFQFCEIFRSVWKFICKWHYCMRIILWMRKERGLWMREWISLKIRCVNYEDFRINIEEGRILSIQEMTNDSVSAVLTDRHGGKLKR